MKKAFIVRSSPAFKPDRFHHSFYSTSTNSNTVTNPNDTSTSAPKMPHRTLPQLLNLKDLREHDFRSRQQLVSDIQGQIASVAERLGLFGQLTQQVGLELTELQNY
jgi:hypothetical protein